MRCLRSAALAGLVLVGAFASAEIPWAKNWQEALRKAAPGNRLIMIDFWAVWCGPCKMMKATTLKEPSVAKALQGMTALSVDAEREGRGLAERYRITGYPTFLFVDSKGEEIGRFSGGAPAKQFISIIKDMAGRQRDLASMAARVKKNPSDAGAYARLAEINASRGQVKTALTQAQKARSLKLKGPVMTQAWLALGESARKAQQYKQALAFYSEASRAGGSPKETAYAHLMAAAIALDLNQPSEAKLHAGMAKRIKGIPAGMVEAADKIMADASGR